MKKINHVSLTMLTLVLLSGCDQSANRQTTGERPVLHPRQNEELVTKQRQMVSREEEPGRFNPLREPDLRQTCINALARLGPSAVPALVNSLQDSDPQVRESSARALARMGPIAKDAVQPLLRSLRKEPDEEVRKQVIRALGQMGDFAADAVPAIIDELRASTK
jgi:HEAT repeat protein